MRPRGVPGVIWLAVLLSACVPGDPPDHGAKVLPCEAVFVHTSTLTLRTDADDPLGGASDVVVWGDRVAVLDMIQGNVKVFSEDGSLMVTLGRPGDGPGEFRAPFAAVVSHSGELWVADRIHSALERYGADGTHRGAIHFDGIAAGSADLIQVPEGPEQLVLGFYALDPEGRESRPGIHLLSDDGRLLRTLVALQPPARPDQRAFATAFADASPERVVVGRYYTDSVTVVDLADQHRHRVVRVGGDVYREPEWPAKVATSPATLTRWAQDQMWLRRLFLAEGYLVAQFFTERGHPGESAFAYTVLDGADSLVAQTEWCSMELQQVARGEAYAVSLNLGGDAVLRRYAVKPLMERTR